MKATDTRQNASFVVKSPTRCPYEEDEDEDEDGGEEEA
jgi:hypothetical protein